MYDSAGLANVALPTLLIGGSADTTVRYQEQLDTYAGIGAKDKNFLTLIGSGHDFPTAFNQNLTNALSQYALAFFGYHMRGQKDYAQYLTDTYTQSVEAQMKLGLQWGTVKAQ